MPESRMKPVFEDAPATPRMRERFDTSPSLIPNTAARRFPPAPKPRWRLPISSIEVGAGCPGAAWLYTESPRTFIAARIPRIARGP